jgi:hypothetical protein
MKENFVVGNELVIVTTVTQVWNENTGEWEVVVTEETDGKLTGFNNFSFNACDEEVPVYAVAEFNRCQHLLKNNEKKDNTNNEEETDKLKSFFAKTFFMLEDKKKEAIITRGQNKILFNELLKIYREVENKS